MLSIEEILHICLSLCTPTTSHNREQKLPICIHVLQAFAVGFRIEHPQATINEMQYRQWATQTLDSQARRGYGKVPVADYKLTAQVL